MRAFLWVVFVAGCVQSSSIDCTDGLICPDGTRCAPVPSHSLEVCALQPDLDACAGMADGTACETSGSCIDGVCLHHCGDGVRTGAEECDGSDLGSNANCTDLGYYDSGPLACSPACTYDVVGDYSAGCTGKCGDGTVNGPELCEDSLGWQDARTCVDFGLDYGDMSCAQCGPSFAQCKQIGFKPKLLEGGTLYGRARDDVWLMDGSRAYHYDGTSWGMVALPANGFSSAWVEPTGHAWAAGQAGTPSLGFTGELAYWDGTAWSNVPVSLDGGLYGIWASGAGDAWAVGGVGNPPSQTGVIVHVIGGTAEAISIPTMPALRAIWGSGASDVWAVGDGGTIVHYDGGSWQQVSSPSGNSLTAIYGSSATDVWTVAGGEVLHDAGAGWTQFPAPAGVSMLNSVWTDGTRVWIGGYLCLFEYDGALWHSLPASSFQLAGHAIWGSSATDVWVSVIENGGAAEVTHYSGAAWAQWHVKDASSIASAWFDGTHVWASASTSGNADVFEYDGTTWSLQPAVSGAQVAVAFAGTSKSDVWALRDFVPTGQPGDPSGEIDHFDGSSWTMKRTIQFPTRPPTVIWANTTTDAWAVGDGFWHWDGGSWTETDTTLSGIAVWGSGPGDVWAVSTSGQILHYNGTSWSESLPAGNQIQRMWGSGPSDVWAVGSAIFHYDGSAWTTTQLPPPFFELVTGTNASDVFVVASDGELYHWDGLAWNPVRTGYSIQPASISASGHDLFFGLYTTGDVVDLVREPGW